MSHGDRVDRMPPGFHAIARSANSPVAGMADESRRLYAIQFHPEVNHTQRGREIIGRFVHDVCGCAPDWTPANIIEDSVAAMRARVGGRPVLCGLSGGVDSSVTAALVHRAVGDQLTCVFVDTGLLRKGEPEQVVETFQREQGIRLIAVNASEEFLDILAGVTDPEEKRKRIGEKFVRVFESVLRSQTSADARSTDGPQHFPGPGHAVPRRDRVARAGAPGGGQDQDPPQRGRLAERHAV